MSRTDLRPPPLPEPHWVDTQSGLDRVVERLRSSNALVALDTETTLAGQHFCVLALVQVSDGDSVWLIDPLEVDPSPLLRLLFGAPWLPPIFHDASGDLMVLKRLYGRLPEAIIDTLLASQALGMGTPNLRFLTEHLLGWRMDKAPQQSNWLRRPLSDAQFEYAALDVFALPHIERLIRRHVIDLDVEDVFQASCVSLLERLKAYEPPEVHPFEERFFRRHRDRPARMRLRRLLEWRTDEANRGRIDILMGFGNETLARIALQPPASARDLHAYLPGHLVERYGRRVLRVLGG